MNLEVWCEACREWWPLDSPHGLQFRPLAGGRRYPRRVRAIKPNEQEQNR